MKKIAILLILTTIFATMVFGGATAAFAASSNNIDSNVLFDLESDMNFRAEDYPENSKDYKLELIQIAETSAGELLLYVYQPSGAKADIHASTVVISKDASCLSPKTYKLKYCNSEGTLYKYKVLDFTLSEGNVRYYSITNILRPYDKKIDASTGNDNTISEVPNVVAQLWQAKTQNDGTVTYVVNKQEVIQVTVKYLGYCRYSNGYSPLNKHTSCDSHWVAFDTDKEIETLLSVDLEYTHQTFWTELVGFTENHGQSEKETESLTVTFTETGENNGDLWFGKKRIWNRIQTSEEFIENEDLTDSAQQEVAKCKWVLRFVETDWINYDAIDTSAPISRSQYTVVSDVILLKMVFQTNGRVYRLGVVDNKQTEGLTPSNKDVSVLQVGRWTLDWDDLFKLIIVILAIIAIVVLACAFPGFAKALLWIFKALWFLICWPFKLIANAVKKKKGSKKKSNSKSKGKKKSQTTAGD